MFPEELTSSLCPNYIGHRDVVGYGSPGLYVPNGATLLPEAASYVIMSEES